MTTITTTATSATSAYRMPRDKENPSTPSRVLYLTWNGQTARMTGGQYGDITLVTDDRRRVARHWAGYVSNNRGRATSPSIRWIA